ncbi:MAG: hypothetical protein NUW37_12465 [Planctomycetes bacterium]|nr:hypothetical protein [Planctomycetota bacterium]
MKNAGKAIESAKRKKPFVSFEIDLENGDTLKVSHPETIIGTHGTYVLIGKEGVVSIFDEDSITQIRMKPGRAKGPKSTAKRK